MVRLTSVRLGHTLTQKSLADAQSVNILSKKMRPKAFLIYFTQSSRPKAMTALTCHAGVLIIFNLHQSNQLHLKPTASIRPLPSAPALHLRPERDNMVTYIQCLSHLLQPTYLKECVVIASWVMMMPFLTEPMMNPQKIKKQDLQDFLICKLVSPFLINVILMRKGKTCYS